MQPGENTKSERGGGGWQKSQKRDLASDPYLSLRSKKVRPKGSHSKGNIGGSRVPLENQNKRSIIETRSTSKKVFFKGFNYLSRKVGLNFDGSTIDGAEWGLSQPITSRVEKKSGGGWSHEFEKTGTHRNRPNLNPTRQSDTIGGETYISHV